MRTEGGGESRGKQGVTRRGFLQAGAGAGGLGALGLAGAVGRAEAASTASPERAVILLLLVGGPSQL